MLYILIVVYMAVTARMSGGGIGAQYLDRFKITWLPEVFFALPFGFALSQVVGPWGWLAAVWSYLWMQTGHGTVLQWGRDPVQAFGRIQTLTPVVDWLAKRLGLQLGKIGYCRLFMAVKGFLIGLPVGGLPLAILWPLAYEIGVRAKKHEVSELLSGAFAGVSIIIFTALI